MIRDFAFEIDLINNFLVESLWMDFEILRMDTKEIIFSGKIEELYDEVIRIRFIEPFYISAPMKFTYDSGEFITTITGDKFIENNIKYKVLEGNNQFRINLDNKNEYIVIAQDIEVIIK